MQADLIEVQEGVYKIQANLKKLERAINDPEEDNDIDWALINNVAQDLFVGTKHVQMEAWKEMIKEDQHVTRLRTSIY